MTGLGNLIIRNCKLFFKDKGMFFTSLITPLILLVLYATFLANIYRESFASALPMGFVIDDKKLRRAGLDYWDKLDISYYDGMDDFFARNPGGAFFYFTTKGQHRHSDVVYPKGCYLIFGREDAGLPEELLFRNPGTALRIPMRPTLRSLNLSNSVAIAAYEVLRQWDYPDMQETGELRSFDWADAKTERE